MATLPTNSSTVENCSEVNMSALVFIYKWDIQNYSERCENLFKSPTFSAFHYDQYKWRLHHNPISLVQPSKVLFNLELISDTSVLVSARIHILKDKCQRVYGTASGNILCQPGQIIPLFWNEAMYRATRTTGTLSIYCDITLPVDAIKTSDQMIDCKHKLSQDIGHLLEDETFKDVTLIVAGAEIKAHKIILAARSVVFKAMFAYNMTESKSNRVTITDFSYEVVKEMLRFIYTGKILNIDNIADELLMAAEKYALMDLKKLCEMELSSNFSVETAADMLVLAEIHSADYLKERAVKFISANSYSVLKTQGWENMVISHPHLITETVKTMIAWQTMKSCLKYGRSLQSTLKKFKK